MAVVETVVRYRWVALALALMSQISATLVTQSIAPLAPLFRQDLRLSNAEVGMFSGAAFTGGLAVMILAGSLADRHGVRRAMSLSQMAAGSLLLLLATAGSGLHAAAVMLVVGAARSPVFTTSTKAIVEWFPPRSRATAMGLKQTGAPVAGILAAATLPALGWALGWRVAVMAVAVTIVAGGVVAAAFYRDPAQAGRAQGHTVSMRASLGSVLRNRSLWILGSLAFLFGSSQQTLITYLALYFNDVVLAPSIPETSARVVAAGGFLAVGQMGGALGRVLWGMVSDRFFPHSRVMVMALIGGLGALMMATLAQLQPGLPGGVLMLVAFASGGTVIGWNGVMHTLVAEVAGRKHTATAVGLCLTMLDAGMALGPPLFGLIVDSTGSYRAAWWFLCGLSATGAMVALLVSARKRDG